MSALIASWPLVVVGLLGVAVAIWGVCAALDNLHVMQQQVELMQGGLHVDGVRVIDLKEGRQPIFFVKIVNSGPTAVKDVSIGVKVVFEKVGTAEYKSANTVVIPARGAYELPFPSSLVLKEEVLNALEKGETPLRVSGHVKWPKETIEYRYKYYSWPFGERPEGLPYFLPCDFDTSRNLGVSAAPVHAKLSVAAKAALAAQVKPRSED